jgi:hypothetical protein
MPLERQVKAAALLLADRCCFPDKRLKLIPLEASGHSSEDMDVSYSCVVIMQGSRPGDGSFQPLFKPVHHLSSQLLHV